MAPRPTILTLTLGLTLIVAPLAACTSGGSSELDGTVGDSLSSDAPDGSSSGGSLVINEVMSYGPDRTLAYVELYNPSAEATDLGAYSLVRYAGGAAAGQTIPLSGTLDAGDTWTLGTDGALAVAYEAAFGAAPDQFDAAIGGDGTDAWALEQNGQPVDVYGAVGVGNEEAAAWRYVDQVAVRLPAPTATATWRPEDWLITPDYAVQTMDEPNWAPARWDSALFGQARFAP